jgi:hypothetical protein
MLVASVRSNVFKFRGVLAGALVLGTALLPSSQANAVSASVRFACAGDYFAHCSSFSPNSAETRTCMRAVGYKLSKGCISALVAAGEVSKTEIARRQASQH